VTLASTDAIAFLFTDIEGSTRLWEQFPEAMKSAVARHDAILRAAVETSGGQVVKTTGDGLMAAFERCGEAVRACVVSQRDLGREPWGETGPLRVRMGVHVGQADQRGGDFFGPTVNRTARIMALGHGGQVLFSGTAAAMLGGQLPADTSLQDLGEHRLKDLGRPEHIFQLVHPDLASTFPPLAAVVPISANLPARGADLIGRRAELQEIGHRLADPQVRLLTLTGSGGTGKTTLAIRAAEDAAPAFAGGVAFVDLSDARDSSAVLVAIARAIGLSETADRSLEEELVARLRERRMLLVIDNFEQVAEAAGAVANLLRDCPRLVVLATSRQPLHVRAEQVLPVNPMALPPPGTSHTSAAAIGGFEAVQLLIDRARVVRPDFQLTDENASAIAEICRRLDGLPLAIELAAARLRLFTPDILLDRLGDRLGLLRSGPRDLPERQQTLRATMDWSYELLEPGEQRLFEFMAVFADAEIEAIETVAATVGPVDGEELDVLDGLAGLLEKSLLRQVEQPGAAPRITMLETIREFARDRLDQRSAFADRARRAHAAHFADLARGLRSDLMGGLREDALALMVADLANLRLAWTYWVLAGDVEQLEALADSLLIVNDARSWYLDTVRLTTDMLEVLGRAAPSPDRVSQEIALRVSLARALMATKGFTEEVEDAFVSAVDLFERGADSAQQFSVLRGLASMYQFRAQFEETTRLGHQILELGLREGDARIQIDGLLLIGTSTAFIDDLQGGLDLLDRAIALFAGSPPHARTGRVANDPRVACYTTAAFTLWLQGHPDRAVERANEALALAAQLDHPLTTAYARFHSGLLHLWRREPDIVLERALGLIEVANEYDLGIWSAVGKCLLGAAQVYLGKPEEGRANITSGLGLYQGRRSPPVFWPLLLFVDAGASLGAGLLSEGLEAIDGAIEFMSAGRGTAVLPEFHLLKGDLLLAVGPDDRTAAAHAAPWFQRGLDRATELGARMTMLRAATRLGRLRQAVGDADGAARLLGPILDTFDEGFGTADLIEAQRLLAAVAPASIGGSQP
jgi:predicted ATPase/class 3 adenylate cyclase